MAEIIDLQGRKKAKEDLANTEKVVGLQSLLQCSQCGRRCAKCGSQGESTSHVTHPSSGVSFRLCSICLDEYTDLIQYLDTGRSPQMPSWYNREWVRQWLAWLDYQWAMSNYVSSPEVLAALSMMRED